MIKKGMTIQEATERWVFRFNRFPQGMIEKLMKADPDSWQEVTRPSVGDMVNVFNLPEGCEDYDDNGKILCYLDESDTYRIRLEDGNVVEVRDSDFDICTYGQDALPMWGYMWQFGESVDDYWLEEKGGLQAMSDCGFRIYEHEEWGYFFGIDGAGYDFYESHWIPLYRKRGMQWHDPDAEDE